MNFETILALDEQPLKEALRKHLEKSYDTVINQNGFLYGEGRIPVLLVCHLDTVHKNLSVPICWSNDGRFIMSPNGIGGDDRCGVYMILELIKELNCHVLFCEQEEVGCVGAKAFCKSDVMPDVNYIIEFDRKGSDDSVFYDCENDVFEKFVNSVGFKTQWGSCSDITYVAPYIGVAAVNLSSGYYNPHSLNEFIDMYFVDTNVERAKSLILSDFKTKFEYVKKKPAYSTAYGVAYSKKGTCSGKDSSRECGTGKKTDAVGRTRTRGNVIITRLLMQVDQESYWIYETEWDDCPTTARYYVDKSLNAYIEYNGIFESAKDLKIFKKETLTPPEFVAKKAKLCDINFDEETPF